MLRLSPDQLDALISSWPSWERRSPHLEATLIYLERSGHLPGAPSPLRPGRPIPGCGCADCQGLPADHAARRPRARLPRPGIRGNDLEQARSISILDVAEQLGLGRPKRAGREHLTRCPLHDDSDPSMRLNPRKGMWYCDPCAQGGDVIGLVRAVQGSGFKEAVAWLLGREPEVEDAA